MYLLIIDFCSCNLHSCAAYEPWRHPCLWSQSRGNGYSPFMSNTVLESCIFVTLLCMFWGNLCKQVQYVFNYEYFRVTLMLWRRAASHSRDIDESKLLCTVTLGKPLWWGSGDWNFYCWIQTPLSLPVYWHRTNTESGPWIIDPPGIHYVAHLVWDSRGIFCGELGGDLTKQHPTHNAVNCA